MTTTNVADPLTLGRLIRQHRKAQGMSQRELGERVAALAPILDTPLRQTAVSAWETDTNRPSIELLRPLARVLKVDVSTLLDAIDA